MANQDKLPDSPGQWERLMPASSRSRFWLGIKVLGWALGVGASVATLGVLLGWLPVLIALGVSLVLGIAFFSAYLHRRAWIVLGEEMRRADEADGIARQVIAQAQQIMSDAQEQTEAALQVAKTATAETQKQQAYTERALKVAETATSELQKRQALLDEVSRRIDRISEKLGIK